MTKKRVLFVCIHNSARSQMAEEYLRKLVGDRFEVESAGLEPGTLNPFVVEVLREDGMDISQKETRAVSDLFQSGATYDYVITVCDESSAERCPVFPGVHEKIHWGFEDPSCFKGTDEEKKDKVRVVRDVIVDRIKQWVST